MSNADIRSAGGVELALDLGAIGRALWQRKRWIVLPMLIVCGLTFVGVNMVTPRFKSEARVLVEGRENVFLRPDAEKSQNDSLVGDQEAIANQVQIALSREVALDVIRKLKLGELPEFNPALAGPSILQAIRSLILPGGSTVTDGEERILESYYDRLTVYAVEKSRVIVIDFQSANAELAAKVANAIAEAYIERQRLAKQEQARGASQWLAGEIEKLRAKVAEAEGRVEAFRSKSNLLVGPNNTSLSNQQLGELNSQLSAARGQQADSETRAKSIRELLRKGGPIETSDVLNSDIVRRLSEQRAILRGQLAEQSSTLLDAHPRIKELKAQIVDIDGQIRGEAEKLVRSFENDARQAAARVDSLSGNLDTMKKSAGSSNELDVQLRALEREAKAQRDLFESYLAKYRESTARETIASAPTADSRIISRAVVSKNPYFPKKLPTVLVAALATMLLSCGIIVTGEILRAPPPAFVPPMERTSNLVPHPEPVHPALGVPVSAIGDAAQRVLKTAGKGRRISVLGVSVGDTTLAALTFARAISKTSRVVLISLPEDADEDAPMSGLAVVSSNPQAPGLADVLRGEASIGDAITRDRLSGLHLVASGTPGRDAVALTRSASFVTIIEALARAYDFLVLDAGTASEQVLSRIADIAPRAMVIAPNDKKEMLQVAGQRYADAGFGEVTAATTATEPAIAA